LANKSSPPTHARLIKRESTRLAVGGKKTHLEATIFHRRPRSQPNPNTVMLINIDSSQAHTYISPLNPRFTPPISLICV